MSFSHLLVFLCFFNNTFNFRSVNNNQIFKVRPECDLMTLYNFLLLAKKFVNSVNVVCNVYPLASEASREVANFIEIKNTHLLVYCVEDLYVCL